MSPPICISWPNFGLRHIDTNLSKNEFIPGSSTNSPVAWPWNLAMTGNNHFIAFFNSSYYLDEILSGWPLATRLAFSESKMAANMVAELDPYLDFNITSFLSIVE